MVIFIVSLIMLLIFIMAYISLKIEYKQLYKYVGKYRLDEEKKLLRKMSAVKLAIGWFAGMTLFGWFWWLM